MLGDYRTGRTAQDAETQASHHSRAAGLLHLLTSGRPVGRLPHGKRTGRAGAGGHRGRAAGLPDGPGPGRVHNQPNHLGAGGVPSAADQDTATALSIAAALLSYYTITQVDGLLANKLGVTEAASPLQIAVRFPDDGGADEVVAAIGEQILGPTDVSLSKLDGSPQQRLQRGPGHAHHCAHLQLDPGPRAPLRRYRLGTASNFVVYMSEADNVYDPLYGSFVGDQGAWSTAKMYFTVPPNGVAKLHFGAHFQAPGRE